MQQINIDKHISEYGACDISFLNDMYPDVIDTPFSVNLNVVDTRFNNFDTSLYTYDLNACTHIYGMNLKSDINEIRISNTMNLKLIDVYNKTKNINQMFCIEYNSDLEVIKGFKSLTNANNIYIRQNPMLNEFETFESLKIIHGDIEFYKNGFKQLQGLHKVTMVDNLIINQNPKLKYIDVFNNIQTIFKDLKITHNPSLESIRGFKDLTEVYCIDLIGNVNLKEVIGFDMYKKYSNTGLELRIPDNGIFVLMSFPGLSKLRECKIFYGDTFYKSSDILNESEILFNQFKKTFDIKIHGREVIEQIIENYIDSMYLSDVIQHIIDLGGYNLLPWKLLNTYDTDTIKNNNKIIYEAL